MRFIAYIPIILRSVVRDLRYGVVSSSNHNMKLKRTPPIPEVYNGVHWLKMKLAAMSGGVLCDLCTCTCNL